MACGPRPPPRVAMATLSHLHSNPYIYVRLVPWCNSNPMTASGPAPLRFPVWLGIPKPMIPYPLLGQGGGANCRITPGPHTKLFGGGRQPPPPPPPPPPHSMATSALKQGPRNVSRYPPRVSTVLGWKDTCAE